MTRLNLDAAIDFRTTFLYGAYRSGKTHLAATWPKPAILGSNREGGLLTVSHMDRQKWYEPGVAPLLFAVESPAEMLAHLNNDILPLAAKGTVKTVVIELSFYSDDLIRNAVASGDNTWQKYADLESHIIATDARLKKIPGLRVVYTALSATEDDKKKPSSVLMAGRALPRKMPALCDVVAYLHQEDEGDRTDHLLRLTAYGNFPAGHRYGGKLPRMVRNATYRQLEALLAGKATADDNGNVTMAAVSLPPLKGGL
jgi:hypothetical protein